MARNEDGDAEVIVVGGGHAGIEAALVSARLGVATLLVTGDPDRICTLACNPSIGGSAKGQIVREIDALGGAMAQIIDRCALHVRFLNESKGPAVRALRAQADKDAYARVATALVRAQPGLRVVGGLVDRLLIAHGRMVGVGTTDGASYRAARVVLATGTFLGGRIFRGEESEAAGRLGEAPALGLSEDLRAHGFPTGRLKTGTPPRVRRGSVDLAAMREQAPSPIPLPFGFDAPATFAGPQLPCHVVDTNARTHALVRENLARSPLYGLDLIRGIGPRYCPSIEDKVIKFAHHASHLVFIEPEGWETDSLYVGGFSTSLPAEVQHAMLRTLPGMAEVEMSRAGYAVEYDYVPPTELLPSLETRRVAGLYHAGQLNGTSGYEEAAAQGLIAGINAARAARGRPPVVLTRDRAYLGVLIDDLVSKGVDEPYRMLSSRAEHRVLLRHDNADVRLTPLAYELGSVDETRYARFCARRDAVAEAVARAGRVRRGTRTLAEIIRRPETRPEEVAADLRASLAVAERAAIEIKLAGYVERARRRILRSARESETAIPPTFRYAEIGALSLEAREKLGRLAPATLGAAGRIPGVSPADVAVVSVHLHRHTAEARCSYTS